MRIDQESSSDAVEAEDLRNRNLQELRSIEVQLSEIGRRRDAQSDKVSRIKDDSIRRRLYKSVCLLGTATIANSATAIERIHFGTF